MIAPANAQPPPTLHRHRATRKGANALSPLRSVVIEPVSANHLPENGNFCGSGWRSSANSRQGRHVGRPVRGLETFGPFSDEFWMLGDAAIKPECRFRVAVEGIPRSLHRPQADSVDADRKARSGATSRYFEHQARLLAPLPQHEVHGADNRRQRQQLKTPGPSPLEF